MPHARYSTSPKREKVVDRVARLASTLGDHLLSVAALFVDAADDVSLERNALAEVLAAYERRKRLASSTSPIS